MSSVVRLISVDTCCCSACIRWWASSFSVSTTSSFWSTRRRWRNAGETDVPYRVLKVREKLAKENADPGWYQNPPGTVADKARPDELARDGIKV